MVAPMVFFMVTSRCTLLDQRLPPSRITVFPRSAKAASPGSRRRQQGAGTMVRAAGQVPSGVPCRRSPYRGQPARRPPLWTAVAWDAPGPALTLNRPGPSGRIVSSPRATPPWLRRWRIGHAAPKHLDHHPCARPRSSAPGRSTSERGPTTGAGRRSSTARRLPARGTIPGRPWSPKARFMNGPGPHLARLRARSPGHGGTGPHPTSHNPHRASRLTLHPAEPNGPAAATDR